MKNNIKTYIKKNINLIATYIFLNSPFIEKQKYNTFLVIGSIAMHWLYMSM